MAEEQPEASTQEEAGTAKGTSGDESTPYGTHANEDDDLSEGATATHQKDPTGGEDDDDGYDDDEEEVKDADDVETPTREEEAMAHADSTTKHHKRKKKAKSVGGSGKKEKKKKKKKSPGVPRHCPQDEGGGEEDDDDDVLLPRRSISADGEEIFTDEDVQGYPFSEPDSDANILFTGETAKTARPVVRAATLEKLIQRLTWEAYPDPVFMNAFLLTYRSFTTPLELLQMLKLRYDVPLPTRATSAELEQYIKVHQTPIRLRVFNVAKRWLSDHFYDFAEDRNLIDTLNSSIIRNMITSPDASMKKAGEQLATILKQKLEGIEKEMKIQFNKPPPQSILPQGFNPNGAGSSVKLMDIDPVEMARQLTLIEYSLYRAIKPQECLEQAWNKKTTRDTKAKNIIMMIQRFNQVSHWVTTEIVKIANIKDRAAVLTRFIDIADACGKLNNYNATMEILSGLQCSAIFRLKHTWAMLKKEHKKKWHELTELMSRERSFQHFREHLHNVGPPCIPYLGVYLTDLTFIEDGNKDFVNDSLINFDKRRKISQVIMEIKQYQATPYCLAEIPALRDYLLNLDTFDENEAYSRSLEVEPKNMIPPETHTSLKAMGASWTSGLKATLNKKKEKKQNKEELSVRDKEDHLHQHEVEEEDWGELEAIDDYPFSVPDSRDNIIFDVDVSSMIEGAVPNIKAATLEKLVEKLTSERYCDPSLMDSFLMTQGMFSTPGKIMDLLKKRFSVPLPRDTANTELQERYYQAKVLPVRLRVFNMAKHWVDRYSQGGCIDDERWNKELDNLVQKMLDSNMEKVAAALQRSLQRQKGGYNYDDARRGTLTSEADTLNFTSEDGTAVSFVDLNHEELAQHLTLTEQAMFFTIQPWELIAQSCVKLGDNMPTKDTTPKYHALMEHNERLTSIVLATIASSESTETATAVVSKWLRVVDKCLSYNNYNAVVQILSAIQSPDIIRAIWTGLPFTAKNKINKTRDLIDADNHFSKLQDKLRRIQPPCVPYIGAFVTSIREHFEKLPDQVQGLINFEKFSLISAEVGEFQQYKPIPYKLSSSPTVQRWLTSQEIFTQDQLGILIAKLSMKRGSSKAVLLNKIEQRRSQHAGDAASETFALASSPSGTEETSSEEGTGLGGSPSMTRKLKKAFKPSTMSRSSSVRSTRNTPTSLTSSPVASSPLSARASVRSTSFSNWNLAPTEATGSSPPNSPAVKEEFLQLFKEDAYFRASVMNEIVQSPELHQLLLREREDILRRLREELSEIKQTMISEVLAAASRTPDPAENGVGAGESLERTEAKAKPNGAVPPPRGQLSESTEIKSKLDLPDFG